MDIAGNDTLLTAKEAAALLGVHVVSLWEAVRSGRLPKPVYPLPRAPRWWRSRLLAAVNATEQMPAEAKAERRRRRLQTEAQRRLAAGT